MPSCQDPFAGITGHSHVTICRLLHKEFMAALFAELSATAEVDLRKAISLPAGTLLHHDQFSAWFAFGCRVRHRWMRHEHAIVRFGSELPLRAHTTLRPNGIVLRIDRDWVAHTCPETIPPGALLWPDTRWLVKAVLERVGHIDDAMATRSPIDPPFIPRSALAALALIDVKTTQEESALPAEVLCGLNQAQRDALLRALRSEAHTIWGPPGTGKSTTLAALVEASYRLGDSTLIAAPTHLAADVLLGRVCDRLSGEAGYADGLIIRLGGETSRALSAEKADAIVFDRVVARRTAPLIQERTQLQAALAARGPSSPLDPEAASIAGRIAALDRRIRELPAQLVREARVVCGTMHAVILSGLIHRTFSLVIVDEVPMALLPTTYLVAGLATKSTVLAGDHMQLPPPVATTQPRAIAALATDPIRLSGQAAMLDRGHTPGGVSVLTDQYRMREGICQVVNDVMYNGRLRTVGDIPGRDAAVTLLDTSDLAPRVRSVSRSRECPVHASLTTRLVAGIAAKRDSRGQAMARIRVLTPYRAHAHLIRYRLRHIQPDLRVEVSTVHGSQATEADIVILDVCECAGLPPGAFLRGDGRHATSARLLNVAVTRARENLIVVCDLTWVEVHAGSGVRSILDEVARRGTVISGAKALDRLGGMR